MERFIVVAPTYSRRSGGIHVLHKLSGTLERLGYSCRIAILDSEGARAAELADLNREISAPPLRPADEELISSSIVIYPEIVTSNILGSSRVVWYLLNRDGALGRGKINAGPRDYFLSHSISLNDPRTNYILHSADHNPVFNLGLPPTPWEQRSLTLTYVGKGGLAGPCHVVPGSVLLGSTWPQSQEELASLLQVTRYLFTWDAYSAINTEAVLCGAIPVVMRWGSWRRADVRGSETKAVELLDCDSYMQDVEQKLHLFYQQREEMIESIAQLSSTWNDRVRAFAENAIAHFSK